MRPAVVVAGAAQNEQDTKQNPPAPLVNHGRICHKNFVNDPIPKSIIRELKITCRILEVFNVG